MNKNKIIQRFNAVFIAIFFVMIKPVNAALLEEPQKIQSLTEKVRGKAGFALSGGGGSVTDFISMVISGFLSLLAMIFIILMLTAGFNWMTASGDEEKVNKAKKAIQRAMIGLIIIIASYAITAFVFMRLPAG